MFCIVQTIQHVLMAWIKQLTLLMICLASAGVKASYPAIFDEVGKSRGVSGAWLYAIALTETNTKMNTGRMAVWPWVINHRGKAKYFHNEKQMCKAAYDIVRGGDELFDIGLMQLNWYWQKSRVDSLSDLCDVRNNINIAADIFAEHYSKSKDPIKAAGAYHNPANAGGAADRYMRRYTKHLRGL